jgi:hypothetical protein
MLDLDINRIFLTPEFIFQPDTKLSALYGFIVFPNEVRYNPKEKIMLCILYKSERGHQYSLNKSTLDFATNRLKNGVTKKVYFVCVNRPYRGCDIDKYILTGYRTYDQTVKLLNGHTPIIGKFPDNDGNPSPYWWMDGKTGVPSIQHKDGTPTTTEDYEM